MQVNAVLSLLLVAFSCGLHAGQAARVIVAEKSPIAKVVTLLGDMKKQTEKEAAEDEEAYDKYVCWCQTNEKKKTAAVTAAEKTIGELEAFIEQAAGLEGQLKTEIAGLQTDISADRDSLEQATALKEKETAAYETAATDAKEVIAALTEAVAVLAKVQLLQRSGQKGATVKPLLMQVKNTIQGIHARLGEFRSVMQQDLWDVMSSIDEAAGGSASGLRGRSLSQVTAGGSQPNDLVGDAAGSKSYNSRSGGILGMLSEMKEEFEKNLAAAQKQELEAMEQFQKLRSAKLAEIAAATSSEAQKGHTLANLLDQAAKSKEDKTTTMEALGEDQRFLVGLADNCKANEEEYAARKKVRTDELVALGETIKILTEDDARDLFGKTMSFFQKGSRHAVIRAVGQGQHSRTAAAVDAAQNKAVSRAVARILRTARQHRDWALASLAVRVRLDAFSKVKEMMDKMVVELKAQQKADTEKVEHCKKEIDETEDTIKVKGHEKDDLERQKLGLDNSIAELEAAIKELMAQVADAQVSLKQAGENRKAENMLFQQSVADQRATINILQKAKDRLAQFYAKKTTFVQATVGAVHLRRQAPPPPKMTYEKSAGAGGVLQLLSKILSDASSTESEIMLSEQHAQKQYESLARDLTTSIQADEASISEKTKLVHEAAASKSETEGALLSNGEQIGDLKHVLDGMHLDCDYLLKYFEVRKTARSEEISAIAEAKAILSGADFGEAMEKADEAS